ncbi:hypothetical protein Theco_2262 [Thermobacillus composti KWC4]|uniref:Uncharacterized protein n=1 Tax=Thermobacillus composti (strain DSM 18247 / JCM 13945 / KWC4) TaxID=717605 RepID=L0EGU3_THECK|nr:hypothetical protein Theco_2262 [Thermobacillus composti KWC4]
MIRLHKFRADNRLIFHRKTDAPAREDSASRFCLTYQLDGATPEKVTKN